MMEMMFNDSETEVIFNWVVDPHIIETANCLQGNCPALKSHRMMTSQTFLFQQSFADILTVCNILH